MTVAEVSAWLRFTLVPGVGPRRQLALLRGFGTPEAALFASRAQLTSILPPELIDLWLAARDGAYDEAVNDHLAWLEQPGNRLLTLADDWYPRPWLDLPDAAPVLFLKGRPELLASEALGVVGSRNATPQGISNAEAFSQAMSAAGLCIVSGLASGIDAAAHRGGLAGPGATIAVVGTGLDRVYPASNRELAHRVAQEGLIVSEFVLGTMPRAEHFPRRNRLIAALARGTLVVEAALGSGSLITARQAAELGREVFAIPGSIHSPVARGCHRLIKDGAKLVESADDILGELGWGGRTPALPGMGKSARPRWDAEEQAVLDAAGFDPVNFDTLLQRCNLTADRLCAILLGLELNGAVSALPGGRYQRLQGAGSSG
ncbi:DNA-processing protein DprA [Chitiniphilus eburneus]|uniref:DNA-protecting protein DprA n=1 Tax=Chitiniphilus eburneus TaxID=2571148 RepID=A0A4U0QC20_9NEIS|nr:DNA-processing protein DprA [Chitiniphilus eburneus]TJZ78943.1 DNA-protecting protein DprA [Chitiniphilus eburneus]